MTYDRTDDERLAPEGAAGRPGGDRPAHQGGVQAGHDPGGLGRVPPLVEYDARGDAAGTGAFGSYMAPTGQRMGYANADDAIKGGVPERGYLRPDADPANAAIPVPRPRG
jgi:hypothetical protein